jgi:hypothetical protein
MPDTQAYWSTDCRPQKELPTPTPAEVSYWTDVQKVGGGSSRWRTHYDSLWLWDGDSSGTQEGERPTLQDGTRGLVWDSILRKLSACVMNCKLCVI